MSKEQIDRLREAAKTGKPDGWSILSTTEWGEIADDIERKDATIAALSVDNARLRDENAKLKEEHERLFAGLRRHDL